MPKKCILRLLQGGDRRTIGRADKVAAIVAKDSALFPDLMSGLRSDNLLVRIRYQRRTVLDLIGAAEARSGDLDAAARTVRQAAPNSLATLTAIGHQLASEKDVGKAYLVAAKFPTGESSTVFAFMAQDQADRGEFHQAFQTAGKIEDAMVRGEALQHIAQKQAAEGDYSGARKTFALATAAYPADRPTSEDSEMMIAEGQLSRGELQGAKATVSSLSSAGMRSFGMLSGAEILLTRADRVDAAAWLNEALEAEFSAAKSEFLRYMAIPLQVKLGQKDKSMQAAESFPDDLRLKGFAAVAVTCAEMKDLDGVNAAIERMRSRAKAGASAENPPGFELKRMILKIAAALLDKGEFGAASLLLDSVDPSVDEISEMTIEPEVQLSRVFAMAQQGKFDEARTLALKMRRDHVGNNERGTALRIIATLQTKKTDAASVEQWATSLIDPEDRAYAFIGAGQALLNIEDVALPYSAIQMH